MIQLELSYLDILLSRAVLNAHSEMWDFERLISREFKSQPRQSSSFIIVRPDFYFYFFDWSLGRREWWLKISMVDSSYGYESYWKL